MAEGTSVKEHCLRRISRLNTLEVFGANIDGESQADMILSVSFVARKVIGKEIVQNSELPRIRVWKVHSFLKYV